MSRIFAKKTEGFLHMDALDVRTSPSTDRIKNYGEFIIYPDNTEVSEQASRCMDCGIPYCHEGCPVNNLIPDWNDLVFQDDWLNASHSLHSTNNFPEITGRICPAPCEEACTLNFNSKPVTIKSIERSIADLAIESGWVKPQLAKNKSTNINIAVVGSGPAGLACAQQLVRLGHQVKVYEKNERPGGLLRFGIPDFKLDKSVVDFRIKQMQAEGVEFICDKQVDSEALAQLQKNNNAVILCIGSEHPRDLSVPGRQLDGVHFAMEFLVQQNRRNASLDFTQADITATGKDVVVLGGGDTGSDCIGTANRQGAKSVTQLELMSMPPEQNNKDLSWPYWPLKLRTSSSHEEGCERIWAVSTTKFGGDPSLQQIELIEVDCKMQAGQMQINPLPGTEKILPAQLVLLAMGYVHPQHEGLILNSGIKLDGRGNILAPENDYQTNINNVFAAGDARRGQSLVVWAIAEGRKCALAVHQRVMNLRPTA